MRAHARYPMVFHLLGLLALGLALALGASGCGDSGDEGSGLSGEVLLDGSSTVFPISEAVADEFQRANREVRAAVGTSGTGGGFKKFAAGEIDIADASRPIKPEEAEAAVTAGVEFIEIPIAFDGLSVVVNPENDWVESLTLEDLRKIWEPEAQGSVRSWADVRPEWPDEEIKLYGPGTDSGTFDYFTAEVMGEEGASRGDYTASEDDNVLVQGVSGDKGSFGYFGYAYYQENRDLLKLVPVVNPDTKEPVQPSEQTITDGTYKPLARPLFIYVSRRAADRAEVQAFVNFYLTEATQFIGEIGYVPLSREAYTLALERFEARKTGSLFNRDGARGKTVLDVLQSGE